MRFAEPWFLLLLLPLAAAVVWHRRRPAPAVDGGSARILGDLPASLRARAWWLPGAAATLAAALLIGALARPQTGRQETRVLTEGIDIMLVLDTSSSMLQPGLQQDQPNIKVVKAVVSDFAAGRMDDRLGLVTFAALPRTICPLTLDQQAVLGHLAAVECVRTNGPEDGTGIGAALGHAARKLMDSDARSKVIVLLTDGVENQFVIPPEEAAELCRSLGVRVYTIGAGVRGERNLLGMWQEHEMDTRMLEQVSELTGGEFFRARTADVLTEVYERIDALERTTREDLSFTDYDDRYRWLLAPAAVLLALELLLRRTLWLELAG